MNRIFHSKMAVTARGGGACTQFKTKHQSKHQRVLRVSEWEDSRQRAGMLFTTKDPIVWKVFESGLFKRLAWLGTVLRNDKILTGAYYLGLIMVLNIFIFMVQKCAIHYPYIPYFNNDDKIFRGVLSHFWYFLLRKMLSVTVLIFPFKKNALRVITCNVAITICHDWFRQWLGAG